MENTMRRGAPGALWFWSIVIMLGGFIARPILANNAEESARSRERISEMYDDMTGRGSDSDTILPDYSASDLANDIAWIGVVLVAVCLIVQLIGRPALPAAVEAPATSDSEEQ